MKSSSGKHIYPSYSELISVLTFDLLNNISPKNEKSACQIFFEDENSKEYIKKMLYDSGKKFLEICNAKYGESFSSPAKTYILYSFINSIVQEFIMTGASKPDYGISDRLQTFDYVNIHKEGLNLRDTTFEENRYIDLITFPYLADFQDILNSLSALGSLNEDIQNIIDPITQGIKPEDFPLQNALDYTNFESIKNNLSTIIAFGKYVNELNESIWNECQKRYKKISKLKYDDLLKSIHRFIKSKCKDRALVDIMAALARYPSISTTNSIPIDTIFTGSYESNMSRGNKTPVDTIFTGSYESNISRGNKTPTSSHIYYVIRDLLSKIIEKLREDKVNFEEVKEKLQLLRNYLSKNNIFEELIPSIDKLISLGASISTEDCLNLMQDYTRISTGNHVNNLSRCKIPISGHIYVTSDLLSKIIEKFREDKVNFEEVKETLQFLRDYLFKNNTFKELIPCIDKLISSDESIAREDFLNLMQDYTRILQTERATSSYNINFF